MFISDGKSKENPSAATRTIRDGIISKKLQQLHANRGKYSKEEYIREVLKVYTDT